MRRLRVNVAKMSTKDLRREKQVLSAWIRDFSAMNRRKLQQIDAELARRGDCAVGQGLK